MMNEMRKLMEAVGEFVEEERTSDSSTVNVLGKTELSIEGGRVLNLEVREYNNNKFAEDGIHVFITEDGYDGFNLSFTLKEYKNFVSTINALMRWK